MEGYPLALKTCKKIENSFLSNWSNNYR